MNREPRRKMAEFAEPGPSRETLARQTFKEERLALALDVGVMGTWTIDLARGRAYCDERHERLCGRQPNPDGHSIETWRASLHPQDRERMEGLMQRVAQGLDPVLVAEYRIVWADGSAHWLAVRGRAVCGKNGKPSHIVGVEQDIDERKSLELEVLRIADSEQRRIGQELHDDIQQRLTGLGLMAAHLHDALVLKGAPERGMCARLTQEIGDVAMRVNRLAHGLVPLELGGDGLIVALHRLARATHEPGRVSCVFRGDPALKIRDGFAATHLFRIAQEAVTNALRHSGASNIGISLSRRTGRAVLSVTDNGCGLQPHDEGGRGLRIMAYRASLIGATLKVARAKTRGTQVRCVFPVADGTGESARE